MPIPIKLPAIIESRIPHTSDLITFIMNPLKPCPRFKPGQFLHFAIDEYDPSFNWPESRVFSIANSPTRRDRIKITFSIKGTFTQRMADCVKKNDTVWLKLPYGSFTFPEDNQDLVLVAGGTGITPFVSFLEHAIDKSLENKITFYYGVRNPRHFIFFDILEECQKKVKNFHFYLYTEERDYKINIKNCMYGRIPVEEILDGISTNENTVYFISGPIEMIHAFKNRAIQRNVPNNLIRVDEWE